MANSSSFCVQRPSGSGRNQWTSRWRFIETTSRFSQDMKFMAWCHKCGAPQSRYRAISPEGKGHRSDPEFVRFLFHAQGITSGAPDSNLDSPRRLAISAVEKADELLSAAADNIARGLNALINKFRRTGQPSDQTTNPSPTTLFPTTPCTHSDSPSARSPRSDRLRGTPAYLKRFHSPGTLTVNADRW